MENQQKRRAIDNIRFSIGTKLILIITIIVLLSLGSITALVSWLVRQDLQIAAEANNFEVNSRSAMEAEYTFTKTRSEAAILIQALNSVGTDGAAGDMTNYFFRQNPQAAALVFTVPGKKDQILVNERFFRTQELDQALTKSWLANRVEALERGGTGENLLFNEAPHFEFPLLSLFFAWQKGGGGILFYPENLNKSFGFGTNQSCLINNSGDILIHADSELVNAGLNVANWDFIQMIRESSERNKQDMMIADFRFGRDTAGGANPVEQGFIQQKLESLMRKMQPLIKAVSGRLPDWANKAKQDTGTEKGESYYVAFTKLNIGACIMITSIEYNTVFEGIAATTRRNIYLTATVLFISIMFIWFFSKSISRPLKNLASVARTIEGGSFGVELHPKGGDEIGLLTKSFQRMCTALGIFGRFTNREIAVKAMRGEIKPGGLPKHATVFFSDIRSFTAKSETFTKKFGKEAPNRIVHWLNDYLTQMVDCVEKTNGVVDKFIGDAVMAHWGTAYTAGSPKKDAYNCVKAALLMRTALIKLNKKRKSGDPGDPFIQIGCGINTGIVTAGQIGSDLRMEYTVIGDPVNLASRTEALNKPLGTDILITEDTWNLVQDFFVAEEMPSVTVKGKEKPVRIFAVVNFAGVNKGPRNLSDVRRLLGMKPPDLSKVDLDSDEKKYKIGEEG